MLYKDKDKDKEKAVLQDNEKKAIWGWAAVFTGVLLLYVFTLAPDVVWQDQGDYQYRAAKLDLIEEGDVVRVHPLFIVTAHFAGKFSPFGYAYAANLVSAVFAAVTAANIFVIVKKITGCWRCGVLSAVVCSFSHTFWFLGVQAQTYSMANAAMTLMIVLLIEYIRKGKTGYIYLIGLTAGIGFSAHIMCQIAFAVIFGWVVLRCVKGQIKWKVAIVTVLIWSAGAVLVWYSVWLEYERSGEFLASLVSAIYGKWGGAVFNVGRLGHLFKMSVMFFVLNFPTPLVLLAGAGVVLSMRRKVLGAGAILLFLMLVLYVIFAARYDIPNQNNFFLPAYILVSIYIGIGFGLLNLKRVKLWAGLCGVLAVLMVPTYKLMADAARERGVSLGTRRDVPYRDDYSYYLEPWQQGQYGPRKLAEQLYTKLPEGAVLAAESTVHRPLVYVKEIEGRREDILLTMTGEMSEDTAVRILAGKRVFTVSEHPSYRPVWVEDESWLKEFELSEGEKVYEIILPSWFLEEIRGV